MTHSIHRRFVLPMLGLTMLAVALPAQREAKAPAFIVLDSASAPIGLGTQVTLHLTRTPLRSAIHDLAKQANASIVFDPALADLDRLVSLDAGPISAARALLRLLDGTSIRAMVSPSGSIVLVARAKHADDRPLVAGVVVQPDGPLPGAHVSLVGTRFAATTDASGRFTLGNVPRGDYTLHGVRIGYAPVEQAVRVDTGDVSQIALSMTPAAVPIAAVIVTPGYFGVMQPGLASSQALTRQQIETVPQLGEDVYRAIGRLPGVATTDFSAKFAVRGEPGDELLVTLDGLPLVEPFHLKDMGDALSIVDLAALGGAELMSGGPSSEYGDQLAGVFRLHSLAPRADRARTSVGLSLTNLRAMSQGGFAGGKGGWLVSGRRGYLDLVFKIADLADSIYPRYHDLFAKVTYALPGGGQIGIHGLHAGDQMRFQDAREPRIDSHYYSDYVWATLEQRLGPRLRHETVAWYGRLDWLRLGDGGDDTKPIVRVNDSRTLHSLGLRQDWSFDLTSRALLKFGADLRRESATYDYQRLVARLSVENHAIVVRRDSASIALSPVNNFAALYLSQRIRPVDALTIEAGGRYDRSPVTNDAVISPRLNAAWQPWSRTTVRMSWGDYTQRQSVFSLQVQDGLLDFAPAEHAKQTVVGVEQMAWDGIVGRVEAYDRVLSQVRPRYVNVTSAITSFPELARDRMLVAPTGGRSRGVELSLARDGGGHMDWSASYTISSATQDVNGARIPRPADQPRALRTDWSFHPQSNVWRLTVGQVWHTGWPYTPDVVRIDTIGTNPVTASARATWGSGPLYSARVPAYQRIDARWTRFFDTKTGRVALFFDVYNLFNKTNVRDIYTNVSINMLAVGYGQGNRELLPRIPSFGINWEF